MADKQCRIRRGQLLYRSEYARQAFKLCVLGATAAQLADFFEVQLKTVMNWQRNHSEFRDALTNGKRRADERVARSMYRLAVGYTRQTTKVCFPPGSRKPVLVPVEEEVPPDRYAAAQWLHLRWRGEAARQGRGADREGEAHNGREAQAEEIPVELPDNGRD